MNSVYREILNQLNAEHRQIQHLNQQLEETQSQLVQNEKMAAVGQLAAGIAHEINNPMSFIKSNIECLQDYSKRLLAMGKSLDELFQQTENQHLLHAYQQKKDALDIAYIENELPDILIETLDGTRRIQEITQSLRDFSRLDSHEWQKQTFIKD